MSLEAKVGIFVLIGIALLTYMTVTVGEFGAGKEEGYLVYVDFENIAGVELKAPVTMAGVEIGKVESIELKEGKARAALRIRHGVPVRENSRAITKSTGLLGDKYIEISPGTVSAKVVSEGAQISEQPSADLDKLVNQLSSIATDIKDVSSSLSKVLGGDEGEESLRNIVDNVKDLTANLKRLITDNEEKFNNVMANFETFSQDLKTVIGDNRESINDVVANLRDFSEKINVMADDNEENLKVGLENLRVASEKVQSTLDSLNSITKKVDKGEGTIAKLINEGDLYDNLGETVTEIRDYLAGANRFKFFIDYRGEYLTEESDLKSYLSLRIQPRKDYYYLLGLVDDPAGKLEVKDSVTTTTPGTTVSVHEETTTDEVKFDVQIAKRYHDLTLRGGIFESSGGIGADYHFLRDRGRFTLEAFDFTDERDPNLKVRADYTFFKHLFLSGGVDQILDSDRRSFFLGGGIRFEDEDLKYLLVGGAVPGR